MNIKFAAIIVILFLCFIFRFEKITYSLNKPSQDNISELQILKYLPKENKIFFISNAKSSQIINNIRKNFEIKNQDNLNSIKNSILAYIGIDLGTNKLKDIYENELIITTCDNKENDLDDVLIIVKINEKNDIDDVLNLVNKIDEPNKLIRVFRENKLNYLNYIYRTDDNYILASSNKKLINDSLLASNFSKNQKPEFNNYKELLNNFKNEKNILFTKNFETNKLLNNQNYSQTKDDYIVTLFNFEAKNIILRSFLINNNKNLDIISYNELIKENILDKKNYQISIYNDFLNAINHIKLNSFEKSFLKELNKQLKKNVLILVSDDNWITIFDKKNENNELIDNINLLKDFNKYSLENNDIIYKMFSKNILKKEENIIHQSNYSNIFSAESDRLIFVSNSLINYFDIDLISKEFSDLQDKSYPQYFLNKKINLKNSYFAQYQDISYLDNINYFFKNLINLSLVEFKAIIQQSIPDRTPIFYTETNLKIFS